MFFVFLSRLSWISLRTLLRIFLSEAREESGSRVVSEVGVGLVRGVVSVVRGVLAVWSGPVTGVVLGGRRMLVVWSGLVTGVELVVREVLVILSGPVTWVEREGSEVLMVWSVLVTRAKRVVVDNVATSVEPAATRTKRYFLKLSGFCCYKFKRENIKRGLECD